MNKKTKLIIWIILFILILYLVIIEYIADKNGFFDKNKTMIGNCLNFSNDTVPIDRRLISGMIP